jgi:hypothetical protein
LRTATAPRYQLEEKTANDRGLARWRFINFERRCGSLPGRQPGRPQIAGGDRDGLSTWVNAPRDLAHAAVHQRVPWVHLDSVIMERWPRNRRRYHPVHLYRVACKNIHS